MVSPTELPRTRPAERVLLGLVPGLRTLAYRDLGRGALSVGLGLGLLLTIALVIAGWSARSAGLERLRLDPRLDLVDLGLLMVLVLAYEGLRLAHDLEERTRRPWGPRIVAAAVIPGAVAATAIPSLVHLAPRPLEALWFSASILAVGGLPAALWCGLEHRLVVMAERRRFGALLVLGACLVVGSAWAMELGWPHVLQGWATRASEAGFVVLPRVLGGA